MKRKKDEDEDEDMKSNNDNTGNKQKRPDFKALAKKYAYFSKHCNNDGDDDRRGERERVKFDFKSWEATHDLCKVLLEDECGVRDWSVPKGHLIPGFTQRRNYCEWVESLLENDGEKRDRGDDDRVIGVDIGTGASAIFPLLFTSRNREWEMIGTDITDVAIESARDNCLVKNGTFFSVDDGEDDDHNNSDFKKNKERKIRIVDTRRQKAGSSSSNSDKIGIVDNDKDDDDDEEQPILDIDLMMNNDDASKVMMIVDFTVCNPPFFDTMRKSSLNPKTNFGGTSQENSCKGGEELFVSKMIHESIKFNDNHGNRVRWFTTMVGKKSTLKIAKKLLREGKTRAKKIREKAFVHSQTRRWAIAWSFLQPKTYEQLKKDVMIALC